MKNDQPTTESLLEYFDSRGIALAVDREAGVLRGVKILGAQSRNRRRYLPKALRNAIGLYEGARVNVNHPKGDPRAPRDYQDRMGVIRNVSLREDEGLFADFHFNPKHPLAEQLLWDATHAPQNVGFSHNVQATVLRQKNDVVVEAISKVNSVDLVADPATTQGLFEAAGASDSSGDGDVNDDAQLREQLGSITASQLRRLRQDLVEELHAELCSQINQLQEELELAQAERNQQAHKQRVSQLLTEYGLPALESSHPADRAVLDETFVESLLNAAGEPEVRTLIKARAKLLAGLRNWSGGGQRPVCREQFSVERQALNGCDPESFVKAIT